MAGEKMTDATKLAAARRPNVEDFHARNNELFARRNALKEEHAAVCARLGTGEPDMLAEAALRKVERKLEDVTQEILEMNFGLVRRYVGMFTSRSSEHVEDFESAGKVGLLWAISSYEPERGSFAGWAFKPIQREVLRAVRDADHPNLNPGDFEKRPAVLAAERACQEETGSDSQVDHADVARRAGVTEAQVRRILNAPRLDSLQAPAQGQGEDEEPWEERLPDIGPSVEDQVLVRFQLRVIGRRWLPDLDTRERYVLTRRFGLDGQPEQSLRTIGERLGLSREGARLIQQKALAKLGEPLMDTPGDRARVKGRAG
jgi:RNA polymerase sigma factor (sigma-70 family)